MYRWVFILFCSISILVNAQSIGLYNRTYDYSDQSNAFGNIWLLNQDTSLIDGIIWDNFGKGKRNAHLIETVSGDTLKSFLFGKDSVSYGTGLGQNIIEHDDIIYVIGGAIGSSTIYAVFHKINLTGQILIDSLYDGSGSSYCRFDCIVPTEDGNFLILGSKEVLPGNLDVWLVKMDTNGNIFWEQTYGATGEDGGIKIVKYNSNSFIISSYLDRFGPDKSKIWIKKIDSLGNSIWDKYFDGEDYDAAFVEALKDSSIVIYGLLSTPQNLNAHPFVMKLDKNGDEIWRYWHPDFPDIENEQNSYNGLIENDDSTLVLIGWKWDGINSRTLGFLQKLSNDGDSLWYRELFVRDNENYLTDLKLLENGDFLMAGYVFPDSPDSTEDGWLMRTNCLGSFEHPKDSVVFSENGTLLHAQNFSTYFEYTTITWGDGEIDTLYEGSLQTINHYYSFPGNYVITTITVACNDTIKKTIDYTANPPNLDNQNLLLFPNPNDGNFQVWLDSEELWQLEVFDASGRIVFEDSDVLLKTGYFLNLIELESAIYFVKIHSEDASFMERVLISQ